MFIKLYKVWLFSRVGFCTQHTVNLALNTQKVTVITFLKKHFHSVNKDTILRITGKKKLDIRDKTCI